MNSVVSIGISSVLTKSIIDDLKARGWLKTKGTLTLVASYVINYAILLVINIIDAAGADLDFTAQAFKTAWATVLAAIYSDFKKAIK